MSIVKNISKILIMLFLLSPTYTFASNLQIDQIEIQRNHSAHGVKALSLVETYNALLKRAITPYEKAKTLVRFSREVSTFLDVHDLLQVAQDTFQSKLMALEVIDPQAPHVEQCLRLQKLAYLYQDIAEVYQIMDQKHFADQSLDHAALACMRWLAMINKDDSDVQKVAIAHTFQQVEEILSHSTKYAASQDKISDWVRDQFYQGKTGLPLQYYDSLWILEGAKINLDDLIKASYFALKAEEIEIAQLYLTYLSYRVGKDPIAQDASLTHEQRLARIISLDLLLKSCEGNLPLHPKDMIRQWQEVLDHDLVIREPVKTILGTLPAHLIKYKRADLVYHHLRNKMELLWK